MILAAGLLVLLGVGLFVAAVLTGVDDLYWTCVVVCVAAAVLLLITRRRISAPAPGCSPAGARGTSTGAMSTGATDPARAAEPVAVDVPSEPAHLPEPDVEDVEVTDLLLVVDLRDEVLVLDEHPRYHLEGCVHLQGRTAIPLPVDEARADGFTPCAACEPDRNLATRARKAARGS